MGTRPTFNRQLPTTDPSRISIRAESSISKYSVDALARTRAFKHVAKLHRTLSCRKHSLHIEDRALSGLPQIRRKKAVVVVVAPTLRNDGGVFVADPIERKKIVTNFFSTLWEDREKLHGGIPSWVRSPWNAEVLDLFPLLDGSMILVMALKMGKGKMCANDRNAVEIAIALNELVLDELAQ